MVSPTVTRAVMADESLAITAWGVRRDWKIQIDDSELVLRAQTIHPQSKVPIVFHANLEGYPAMPPAWTCQDLDGAVSPAVFPAPGTRQGVTGSIFHPGLIICAPWNRLAYSIHGGPHNDWTDLSQWRTVGAGTTQAHTLADMLTTIALHLAASPATAA